MPINPDAQHAIRSLAQGSSNGSGRAAKSTPRSWVHAYASRPSTACQAQSCNRNVRPPSSRRGPEIMEGGWARMQLRRQGLVMPHGDDCASELIRTATQTAALAFCVIETESDHPRPRWKSSSGCTTLLGAGQATSLSAAAGSSRVILSCVFARRSVRRWGVSAGAHRQQIMPPFTSSSSLATSDSVTVNWPVLAHAASVG